MGHPHQTHSPAVAGWLTDLAAALERRRGEHLLRELHPVGSSQGPVIEVEGKSYVQFCSNNYLGLADHPALKEAAAGATGRYGVGAGASRLVSGSMDLHHQLEVALARFKGTEAALVFPTGFMANLGVLATLAGAGDVIVSDKLNHASLLDAAKYAGAGHRTFPHRNYARAKDLLGRIEGASPSAQTRRFAVTDSVFSMDGDVANLPALCDAAEATDALVVIDEAHGTGVLGDRGRGLAELQCVEHRIAVTIGTLSKAFGSVGGFVAGPKAVIDTLVNLARPFIYTTALPPATSAASLAALAIIDSPEGKQRRERVNALAGRVRRHLASVGFDTGDSATPIIPVLIGGSEEVLAAAAFLKGRGLYISAIRPPTVPPNAARLRVSLTADHTDAHVDELLEAFGQLRPPLRPISKSNNVSDANVR